VTARVHMPQQQDSLGTRFVLSAVSATAAETATFPLDFIKTRLQLQVSALPCTSAYIRHASCLQYTQ
jgi:hypothetical protein